MQAASDVYTPKEARHQLGQLIGFVPSRGRLSYWMNKGLTPTGGTKPVKLEHTKCLNKRIEITGDQLQRFASRFRPQ